MSLRLIIDPCKSLLADVCQQQRHAKGKQNIRDEKEDNFLELNNAARPVCAEILFAVIKLFQRFRQVQSQLIIHYDILMMMDMMIPPVQPKPIRDISAQDI